MYNFSLLLLIYVLVHFLPNLNVNEQGSIDRTRVGLVYRWSLINPGPDVGPKLPHDIRFS